MVFVVFESLCDYRRSGSPVLKNNGEAADNYYILPTRLRYPADEKYRNPVTYQESLDNWLGGTNNMRTDVWWASTAESRNNRLRGRK
uniref:SusD/RagB family nutrient-binding outer membrane lipoprotein n=1 Tax=Candidatus Cryptobacteroides bacterium TaxID=3085639 RepID=UPI003FEDE85A